MEFFYTITAAELKTLRTMSEGLARGHSLNYSGDRAKALMAAVAALESARALWREYQALKDERNDDK